MRAWLWCGLVIACGGNGDEDSTEGPPDWPATCDTRDGEVVSEAGLCRVWSGEQTADVEDFEELCVDTYGGAFGSESEQPCPGEAVGRCETDQGFELALTYLYYGDVFDVSSAQAHCEGLASCSFACTFTAL